MGAARKLTIAQARHIRETAGMLERESPRLLPQFLKESAALHRMNVESIRRLVRGETYVEALGGVAPGIAVATGIAQLRGDEMVDKEGEASLRRLIASMPELQKQLEEQRAVEARAKAAVEPPPSPLDGGDGGGEDAELVEAAEALGRDGARAKELDADALASELAGAPSADRRTSEEDRRRDEVQRMAVGSFGVPAELVRGKA